MWEHFNLNFNVSFNIFLEQSVCGLGWINKTPDHGYTRRHGVKGLLIIDSPASALMQIFSVIRPFSCLTTSGLRHKIRNENGVMIWTVQNQGMT